MSDEKWTGRKYDYDNGLTRTRFEVLTEPFDWKGSTYVAYGRGSHADTCFVDSFTTDDAWKRVIEPKFVAGDRIRDDDGCAFTVEHVSSAPDEDGDFVYTLIDSDGVAGLTFARGSRWTKVDA